MKSKILLCLLSLSFLFFSCTNDSLGGPEVDENPDKATIWTGPAIPFSKADDADPNLAASQDRITDRVWLTRGNDGRQIFNIRSEGDASKENSPAGTRWAIGTIDQIDDLEFKVFREAVEKPKNVEGKNLVLHLVEDNIYLSVKFTSWSEGKAGGFAYERSTPK